MQPVKSFTYLLRMLLTVRSFLLCAVLQNPHLFTPAGAEADEKANNRRPKSLVVHWRNLQVYSEQMQTRRCAMPTKATAQYVFTLPWSLFLCNIRMVLHGYLARAIFDAARQVLCSHPDIFPCNRSVWRPTGNYSVPHLPSFGATATTASRCVLRLALSATNFVDLGDVGADISTFFQHAPAKSSGQSMKTTPGPSSEAPAPAAIDATSSGEAPSKRQKIEAAASSVPVLEVVKKVNPPTAPVTSKKATPAQPCPVCGEWLPPGLTSQTLHIESCIGGSNGGKPKRQQQKPAGVLSNWLNGGK